MKRLAVALLVALMPLSARAGAYLPVAAPQLPAFAGGDCTTTAGSVVVSCASLLGKANSWSSLQTFGNGLYVKDSGGQTLQGGLVSEVGAQIVDLGLNESQIGSVVSTYRGGMLRVDTRTNQPLFQFFGNNAGVGLGVLAYFDMGGNGSNLPWAVPAVSVSSNSNISDTTANSQNRLSHVANMAVVAGWANTAFPVEVDGTTTVGDGGRRKMIFDNANLCGAGGHPAANGYTCVNSSVVTTGSWNIDWSSVGNVASAGLFENTSTATDDTAAVQAAINTGKEVRWVDIGRDYVLSSDVTVTTAGQIIRGQGRMGNPGPKTRFRVKSNSGFTKGVFVVASGEPGPVFQDFSVVFEQTDTTYANLIQYVPAFYIENQPRVTFHRMGCYLAWVCLDAKQNAGGLTVNDLQMSAFKYGIDIDGSLDTVRLEDLHGFPFMASTNQQQLVNNVTWVNAARVDDLKVVGGLFFNGTVFAFNGSTQYGGGPTASISGIDFDSVFRGITMNAGTINMVGGYGVVSQKDAVFMYQTGGTLTISGFTLAYNNAANASTNAQMTVTGAGSRFSFVGGYVNPQVDQPVLTAAAGTVVFSDNQISQQSVNGNYSNPRVSAGYNSRFTAVGNSLSDLDKGTASSATGNFFSIQDCMCRVAFNVSPGWTNIVYPVGASNPASMSSSLTPTSAGGVYAGN